MDRNQLNSMIQSMVEKEIPPASIDLWPRLKESLVVRRQSISKRGLIFMNAQIFAQRRMKLLAATSIVTLFLATFLLATPQGRVLAQQILNFFSRNETNTEVIPTTDATLQPQPSQVAATPRSKEENSLESQAGCGSILAPRCALAEVQTKVNFPIQTPSQLPEGINLVGAVPIEGGVLLKFEGQGGNVLLAETTAEEDDLRTWTIGKDTIVERVAVGNQPAEYVQGGWVGLISPEKENFLWDQNLPTRTLRWQRDGIQFTLVNFPQSSAHGPVGLDLPQLTALAGSLANPKNSDLVPSETDSLALHQAEGQAGFEFVEPSWLPTGYVLNKTIYNSQHNAICQYYGYGAGGGSSDMVIVQSDWALPQASDLQAKAFYDGKEVAIAMTEKSVAVRGAVANQGTFVETGLRVEALCSGKPTTANRALLWQQGNRTFVIFAQLDANDGRGFVTTQEMRRLAEALNGMQPSSDEASALDPERLLSSKDAATLTSIEIQLPAIMLTNVNFDHIAYKMAENSETGVFSTFYSGQPVGDGRTYHLAVFQSPHSENTLENLQLAGGYQQAVVKGNPAIYQAQCWDATALAGSAECHQILTWFEGSTQFDIITYFPALVPQETMLTIAESMK